MEILFEDDNFLGINKLPGIPVQPDLTGDPSVLSLQEALHGHKLYILNRLDRPVSGVVCLAKNREAAALFSHLIRQKKLTKRYFAASEGFVSPPEGRLIHYLSKKGSKTHSGDAPEKGKRSVLAFKVVLHSDHYSVLEIMPETGRFHQIRAQLAHAGHPIKGDVKYGARRANKDRSIHLHAHSLSFENPYTKNPILLKAGFPEDPLWLLLTPDLLGE